MEDKVKNLMENFQYKAHHVHPMVYEDIAAMYRREKQEK